MEHWADSNELNAHLDQVLIGGRERRPVVLVDSDPAWRARFERERARILEALGDVARRVEHIGSTSVRGLGARPIVDILDTVVDADDETPVVPDLERGGACCARASPGIACSGRPI